MTDFWEDGQHVTSGNLVTGRWIQVATTLVRVGRADARRRQCLPLTLD